ncbi:PqqD family protein [Verrucomicrobiota bacterium]
MAFGRKKGPELSRTVALRARPVRVPVKSTKVDSKGEMHVTMEYERPRWQQRLGGTEKCERTFVLDKLGREVYELCNEKRNVKQIVEEFVKEHKVSSAEAEYSVTTYLKTLLKKDLVAMVVEKQEFEAAKKDSA